MKKTLFLSLPLIAMLAAPALAQDATKTTTDTKATTTETQSAKPAKQHSWRHKKTAKAEEKKVVETKKVEETKTEPAAPVAPAQK